MGEKKFKMLRLVFTKDIPEKVITESLKVLKNGGIVAYPTESFYALGVLATDERAIKKLYELKKRPSEKPLPIIVGDMDTLKSIVKYIPSQAEDLMKRFWPGPLTLIFEAQDNLPALLTGNTGKVAVRIPGDSFALYLARASKFPITATSANISARPPAERADEVINYFGDNVDLIIDAGKTPGGKPSTIVDVTVIPPRVLRKGIISLD
jgi:L-threonylcarbamoyladenylate synthase